MALEKLNNNIINNKNNICKLNVDGKTCLPNVLLENIYQKSDIDNNIPKLGSLIINKIADDCGCNKKKSINEQELCIIKNIDNSIINNDTKECIIYKFFKPVGSHNGNDWLNNTHVDIIQEQLYNKFDDYNYSFIHMIDNIMITPQNKKCINHEIKSIVDIDFINNSNIKWHGIVYNTDPSHKSGQHWFSILFNFNNQGSESDPNFIEYFNSSGFNIQNVEFREFLENLAFRISYETGKKIILKKITNIQHQKSSTGNCGIYSLYYIWCRLSGIKIEEFNNPMKKITDKTMEEFRKIMFRQE